MKKRTNKAKSEPDRFVAVLGLLIIAGVLADAVDFFAYRRYAAAEGVAWFEVPPWSVTWAYLSSPLGATLTLLAIAPWVLLLGWLSFKRT